MVLLLLTVLISLIPHLGRSAYVNMSIVNGKVAKPYSRPYMVSVQSNGRHICGGFLVSNRFVMTAAHCWDGGRNLTVVLGAHTLPNSKSDRMPVKFYHIHPNYDSKELSSDIMLLQLTKPINKSPKINWISIPNKDKAAKVGQVCSIAGWGRQTKDGSISKHLMEVNVTIINGKDCAKSWEDPALESVTVCTRGHGGFCQGDSGGPLVCKNTAVGIVSFNSDPCDMSKLPYVYTRISAFLPWIQTIIKSTE